MSLIEDLKSLMVLAGNKNRRPHLPSWVPDWAVEDNSLYPYQGGGDALYRLYNASNGVHPRVELGQNFVLLTEGHRVDRIVAVGEQMLVNDWFSA